MFDAEFNGVQKSLGTVFRNAHGNGKFSFDVRNCQIVKERIVAKHNIGNYKISSEVFAFKLSDYVGSGHKSRNRYRASEIIVIYGI